MKDVCPNCGATQFVYKEGYKICPFCNSKFKNETSEISMSEDIRRLLLKCEKEPWNARKYANLILDIDSTNEECLKYL